VSLDKHRGGLATPLTEDHKWLPSKRTTGLQEFPSRNALSDGDPILYWFRAVMAIVGIVMLAA